MVPGIDLAGVVERSRDPDWQAGDRVVVTGWGLGETHWGGLAQKARLEAGWLLRCPPPFTHAQAMAIGTAGFTAALCVMALQRHGLRPGDGDVLVTGAAGGVGSVAVALLGRARLPRRRLHRPAAGGRLPAAPRRAAHRRPRRARAARQAAAEASAGPAWSTRVGSHTLANACAQTRFNGAVAACGLAQGADFPTTVMPFILRGVTLYGINSVFVDNATRARGLGAAGAQHLDARQLDRDDGARSACREAIATRRTCSTARCAAARSST